MYAGLLISKSASNRYHFHLHHLHPNPLHLIVVSLVLILLKVHEILLNEEYLIRKLPGFCYMHVFTCADPEIIFGGKGFQTFFPEFYCVNFKKLKFLPPPPPGSVHVQFLSLSGDSIRTMVPKTSDLHFLMN